MTKRKRSSALGIRRKKGRNTKKVPDNVNLITYNNNIIDILSTKDDSSNSDIILLDSTSNTTLETRNINISYSYINIALY